MDDLLDLFDEHYEQAGDSVNKDGASLPLPATKRNNNDDQKVNRNIVSPETIISHRTANTTKTKTNVAIENQSREHKNSASISVDERVGIRMINRLICGTDLLCMVCENNYYSPAQISCMSLSNLNTKILADPAAIIDSANIFGKTNLMTMGIVFSNSGSRISSSGSAFCVIQIGSTIQTGPTVSLMLFGNAYSTYCRSITRGKVIAVFNPKLLPKKDDNNSNNNKNKTTNVDYTTISFTINESDQIKVIADARDYGICKATVSSKNERGQWVPNSKQCNACIDKRISEYCTIHRNQQSTKAGGTGNNKSGSLMNQLRQDAIAFPTSNNRNLKNMIQCATTASSRTAQQQQQQRHGEIRSMNDITKTTSLMRNQGNLQQPNTLLRPNNPYRRADSTITLPITKAIPNLSNIKNPKVSNTDNSSKLSNQIKIIDATKLATTGSRSPARVPNSTNNSFLDLRTKRLPPINRNTNMADTSSSKRSPTLTNPFSDLLNAGSHRQQQQMQQATKKRRINTILNVDTKGYNGSVPVPKAAKLFGQIPVQQPFGSLSLPKDNVRYNQKQQEMITARANEAIAKQKNIANQIRQVNEKRSNTLRKTNNNASANAVTSAVNFREELLFGSLGNNLNVEKVIAATSHFANEVNAEEYARSRRILADLEVEENKKIATENKKNSKNVPGGKILKQYHCKNCNVSFTSKPSGCIRLYHTITIERTIEKDKTTAEHRQALTDTNPEDGGLKIGSGLDWSKWNR